MEWKEYKLGDVCEITSSKRIFYSEYEDSGVPFYRSKEIINLFNKQEIATELFISEERYKEIKEKFGVPQKNDILLTSVGSIGIPYLVKENDKFYFKDGNLTWIRNYDARKIDPLFLYIWIISEVGKRTLEILSMGAAQAALTISRLKEAKIFLPSINEQRAIASILSNYDMLIDTNTKRIKLLEESARELYKEWFVRMRFPGYEQTKFVKGIPENWKIGYLKDIATLLSQKVKSEEVQIYVTTDNMLKDFKGVDYKELTNKPEGKVCYFEKGDILMSNIRPYFKKLWYANQQGGCSADVLIFRANKDIDTHFLFYTMCTDYFIDYVVAGSNGTKMPRGNKVFTMNFPVLVPSKELMGLFRENVSTIYSTIETLQLQNQTLASTRDRLLPRLLNGELKVKA